MIELLVVLFKLGHFDVARVVICYYEISLLF